MNSELQSIGSFQLENLIKARVPFLFVRENFDIESAFGIVERIHIRNFSILLERLEMSQLEPHLLERKTRKEDPIVIMDKNGESAKSLALVLGSQGFINVFFVEGGWNSLRSDLE